MAISVVQTATIGAFNNPPITFASNVTAGNTVLLAIAAYHSGAGSITTSAPTLGGSPVTGSTAFFNPGTTGGITSVLGSDGVVQYCAVWMLPNCAGGSKTVGWTGSGQSGFVGCFAIEVAGLGASPVLDQSISNSSGSSTSVATGSTGTTTAAPEIILAAAAIAEGYSTQPGSPWTILTASSSGNGGYQIATSSGSNYSWSQTGGAGAWTAGIVTVAASIVPGPAPLYPKTSPVQGRVLPRRGGNITTRAGGPVANPNAVAVSGSMGGPVRASLGLVRRGHLESGPIPVPPAAPPPTTAPLLPARTVRARLQPRPGGRAAFSPGAPVNNPSAPLPPVTQPVRTRVLPLPPRGRTMASRGGPVSNPPGLVFTIGSLTATDQRIGG